LSSTPNQIVDLLQRALAARGLQPLTKRCATIHLEAAFDQVRPYKLTSNEEVFGLFDAGWSYLKKTWTAPSSLWKHFAEDAIERIANDLTEKSIRNRMIVEGWNASAHPA